MEPTVLKLGGELLDDAAAVSSAAAAIVRLASRGPLVVVHGGGRIVDAELRARGATPRFADGLRITDESTLETVVGVLAGRTNTRLVAAVCAAGGRAVGLTGADAGIGLSARAPVFRTAAGEAVDLGLVGEPAAGDPTLLEDLLRLGYVPIVASIGATPEGTLLNVNADTLAAALAGALSAGRLIVAGTTPGVLDRDGRTIATLTLDEVSALTASGAAHSGMVAKLTACRHALSRGVAEVAIVAGRGADDFETTAGTKVYAG